MPASNAKQARIVALPSLGLLFLTFALGGCSTAVAPPATSAADAERQTPPASTAGAPDPSPEAIDTAAEAPRGPADELPENWLDPVDEGEIAFEAELDPVEQILPGEVISGAPHDELGSIAPELSDAELAELERIAALPPEFDIPMVSNEKVLFWLDYYSNRKKANFQAGLIRSGRYMPMFREIFAEAGLPLDLIYMAHVESAYKTTAYSRARAAGIFQFMSGTARMYGLKIDYWVDERRDPEKSARAAAAYLKKLYGDFGDWHLAMAAYNAGEGKIGRALRRSGEKDFWGIARTRHIRRETKNYLPAILAATMISKEPWKYGFEFEPEAPIAYDSVGVEGAVDLRVLAECSGSDLATLKRLNPSLRRYQTPPHTTTDVRVPSGTGTETLIALARVPTEERVLFVQHKVGRGDTLYDLARAYGVTVGAIQQANQMGRKTTIRIGRVLKIPSVASGRFASPGSAGTFSEGEVVAYRVRRGDTLSGIARRYNTSSRAIAAASGVSVNGVLSIGTRLTVVPGVRSTAQARRIAAGPTEPRADGEHLAYRVRRGDSLWRIAQRHDTTVGALCALNQISRSAVLRPGTLLKIRN